MAAKRNITVAIEPGLLKKAIDLSPRGRPPQNAACHEVRRLAGVVVI